jgi:transcription initiation factor IIE alpha subunit
MVRSTEKARKAVLERKAEERAERALELYDFIERNPGETGYSIHRRMNIPLNTIQSLLDDLLEENLIKIRLTIEKSRAKKRVYVMTFADYSFDEYTEDEVDDLFLTSILRAVEDQKITVLIHRKNGDQIQLSPA